MQYSAIVSKISVRPHPDADRIQIGNAWGSDVIVGLDVKDGDLGLYFAPDGQLSEEFAKANDLVGYTDPETHEKKGGYFGKSRRVKAQKFRGVNSYGFWIPIESLDKLNPDSNKGGPIEFLLFEGDLVTQVDGVSICNKYVTPATMQARAGKGGRFRRQNSNFAKHYDTEQLRRSIKNIQAGSIIYLSEKIHGTSQRTGYVVDKYTHRRTIWQAFCCGLMGLGFKRDVVSEKYKTVTGTRNMILKGRTEPMYYSSEEFRGVMEDKVRGNLKKGEILYYEVVGYTTSGKSIMPSVKINDKKLKKLYGKTMNYSYGCKEKECKMYVYRITNVNEDGQAIDLSWPMVMARCKELGVEHVPNLNWVREIDDSNGEVTVEEVFDLSGCCCPYVYHRQEDDLLEAVEILAKGHSILDPTHIREGVVVRVESENGVTAYKEKSHEFLVLEGLAKDDESCVDMEESA